MCAYKRSDGNAVSFIVELSFTCTALYIMAIEPLEISDDTSHKVTMFNSPDHSIKPLVDFIKSAEKSIDMYIPGIDVIATAKTA